MSPTPLLLISVILVPDTIVFNYSGSVPLWDALFLELELCVFNQAKPHLIQLCQYKYNQVTCPCKFDHGDASDVL
ncbi:8127_t:CDS:2 [Funneliformis geosporum]|uniref:8127_t:CDS:1 n=1 Tax=Funneliformis geosporum TaxID=1117311 RepID=A0A9W4SEM5_9GLOM|nr:8127_t:CDS:2 [Funneliformis geosporum]